MPISTPEELKADLAHEERILTSLLKQESRLPDSDFNGLSMPIKRVRSKIAEIKAKIEHFTLGVKVCQ